MKGRPSEYTQEIAEAICGYIAEGMSVANVAKQDGMPPARTIFSWLARGAGAGGDADDPMSFLQQYTRARASRADARFEKVDEIMEQVASKEIDPAAARVMLDAIKWQTGKENYSKYGEKVEVNNKHSGSVGFSLTINPVKK